MKLLAVIGRKFEQFLPDYMTRNPRVLTIDASQRGSEHVEHIKSLERRSALEAMGNVAVRATEQEK